MFFDAVLERRKRRDVVHFYFTHGSPLATCSLVWLSGLEAVVGYHCWGGAIRNELRERSVLIEFLFFG